MGANLPFLLLSNGIANDLWSEVYQEFRWRKKLLGGFALWQKGGLTFNGTWNPPHQAWIKLLFSLKSCTNWETFSFFLSSFFFLQVPWIFLSDVSSVGSSLTWARWWRDNSPPQKDFHLHFMEGPKKHIGSLSIASYFGMKSSGVMLVKQRYCISITIVCTCNSYHL